MQYPLWRSKEVKNLYVMILGEKGEDVLLSYEINSLNPKHVHTYKKWYLEQFFEYDSMLTWSYNNV